MPAAYRAPTAVLRPCLLNSVNYLLFPQGNIVCGFCLGAPSHKYGMGISGVALSGRALADLDVFAGSRGIVVGDVVDQVYEK